MKYSVLASGSRANSCLVKASRACLLIDAGLSGRATEQRLAAVGINLDSLKAIFVTHEHRDHINGAGILSRKLKIPIFANRATAEFIDNPFGIEYFETGVPFEWKGVHFAPFQISHDAVDPVGFRIEEDGRVLGYATDIGRVTPLLTHSLSGCHAIVLEANHDRTLLYDCEYPWQVKQRISSSHGHLSNDQTKVLLKAISHQYLSSVVLAHLSEQSNTPQKAMEAASSARHKSPLVKILCGNPRLATPLTTLEDPFSIETKIAQNLDSLASTG